MRVKAFVGKILTIGAAIAATTVHAGVARACGSGNQNSGPDPLLIGAVLLGLGAASATVGADIVYGGIAVSGQSTHKSAVGEAILMIPQAALADGVAIKLMQDGKSVPPPLLIVGAYLTALSIHSVVVLSSDDKKSEPHEISPSPDAEPTSSSSEPTVDHNFPWMSGVNVRAPASPDSRRYLSIAPTTVSDGKNVGSGRALVGRF